MVVIINYGVGNMASLTNALRFLGIAHEVTSDTKAIAHAPRLVLPGAVAVLPLIAGSSVFVRRAGAVRDVV